ncbi:hypothetical protein BDZ91DRAFT_712134 [Kalaharituber pfeilii]|nr:hypothetical protein BDZ91DRAFT_712134 [Kalaharituber pfeilii]
MAPEPPHLPPQPAPPPLRPTSPQPADSRDDQEPSQSRPQQSVTPIPAPQPPLPLHLSDDGIPTLYPPELFAIIHDGIYRCTSIDYSSKDFLRTLNLTTLLTLTVEKPRPPLPHLRQTLQIPHLIHHALWTLPSPVPQSTSSFSSHLPISQDPAWRQAVHSALQYLAPKYRPVLIVDPVGVFCAGVIRRGVMKWNLTVAVLEYRSFFWGEAGGGGRGRYACEEVVEVIGEGDDEEGEGEEEMWGGEAVRDLRPQIAAG